jgi:hypothetical protein
MLSGGALNSTMAIQRHANQLAAAASGSLLQAWEAELNVAFRMVTLTQKEEDVGYN